MSTDIVSFDILINGTTVKETTEIVSIEVEQNNTKNIARVELLADASTSPIPINSGFKLGDDLEIKLGYDNKNATVFKGKITDKGVRLSQGVGAKNIFICEDDAPKHGSGKYSINANNVFNIDLGCNVKDNVEGGIEIQGTSGIKPGTSVALNNIIEDFPSSPAHTVTHEVSEGNWFTSIHFVVSHGEDTKIELSTRNGNKIVLDDESNTITIQDANSNSILFSESGIDIKSPKNITNKANQNISITGDMGISQSASSGDVSINGLNTKITADVQASFKGSTSAEVQGGAQLVLKGAMVMIN